MCFNIKFISKLISNAEQLPVLKQLIEDVIIKDLIISEIIFKCIEEGKALDILTREVLIGKIERADINCANYDGWIFAFSIVMHTGNFDIAYALRENAKKHIYTKYNSGDYSFDILSNCITAALEDEKDELYSEVREKLITLYKDKVTPYIDKLDIIFSFCKGEKTELSNTYIEKDKEYYNYINNKNISLVIPTDVEYFDGSDIDSSDIVVRLNYTSKGQGCNLLHKGTRTDISYYNGMTKKKIMLEYNGIVPNDLKFISSKSKIEASSIGSRITPRFNEVMLIGSFNMLPIALIDLLLFNPKTVKIYHSDMQLTAANRVSNYYGNHHVLNENNTFKINVAKSFSNHDPFSQLNLIRRIVNNSDNVQADKVLENVLNMTTNEYAIQLTNNYKWESDTEINELFMLKETLKLKEKKLLEQKELIKNKDLKIKQQKNIYHGIKNSISWKITQPLRSLKKLVSK